MSGRDNFDITPQQYHHGLDQLWAALGLTDVQDEDVFTLSARRIAELQAIVDKYRKKERQILKDLDLLEKEAM